MGIMEISCFVRLKFVKRTIIFIIFVFDRNYVILILLFMSISGRFIR